MRSIVNACRSDIIISRIWKLCCWYSVLILPNCREQRARRASPPGAIFVTKRCRKVLDKKDPDKNSFPLTNVVLAAVVLVLCLHLKLHEKQFKESKTEEKKSVPSRKKIVRNGFMFLEVATVYNSRRQCWYHRLARNACENVRPQQKQLC